MDHWNRVKITSLYNLLLVVMRESAAVRVLVMFSPLLVRYGAVYCVFIASTIKYPFKSREKNITLTDSAWLGWRSLALAECLLIIVLLSPLTNLLSGPCLQPSLQY